jgi:heme-degrading monooxygenase HmoA
MTDRVLLRQVATEHAVLNVRPGQAVAFEDAFRQARKLIANAAGFVMLELHHCLEHPNRYLLIVRWRRVEDHFDFRTSDVYSDWSRLLHHFYARFPTVEHYALVQTVAAGATTRAPAPATGS